MLLVNTTLGLIAGASEGEWRGVPFAEPPLGVHRWGPPRPKLGWTGVLNASHSGTACVQDPSAIDLHLNRSQLSESCLWLDVWAPPNATHESSLPVLVWMFGGAVRMQVGSASSYLAVAVL